MSFCLQKPRIWASLTGAAWALSSQKNRQAEGIARLCQHSQCKVAVKKSVHQENRQWTEQQGGHICRCALLFPSVLPRKPVNSVVFTRGRTKISCRFRHGILTAWSTPQRKRNVKSIWKACTLQFSQYVLSYESALYSRGLAWTTCTICMALSLKKGYPRSLVDHSPHLIVSWVNMSDSRHPNLLINSLWIPHFQTFRRCAWGLAEGETRPMGESPTSSSLQDVQPLKSGWYTLINHVVLVFTIENDNDKPNQLDRRSSQICSLQGFCCAGESNVTMQRWSHFSAGWGRETVAVESPVVESVGYFLDLGIAFPIRVEKRGLRTFLTSSPCNVVIEAFKHGQT